MRCILRPPWHRPCFCPRIRISEWTRFFLITVINACSSNFSDCEWRDLMIIDDKSVSNAIPLLDSSSNFFRHMILPLALSDETVMHMVLATGALALVAKGQQHLYPTALRHKQRSMQLLRKQISADAFASATDANIIVILMLCVFEVCLAFHSHKALVRFRY